MNELKKPKLLFVNISLATYIFIYLRHILNIYYKEKLNYSNTKILIYLYIYEIYVALYLKQRLLYKWKKKDYLIHHGLMCLGMITTYNMIDLDKYYLNMQFYAILINMFEIIALLQNYGISKKMILFSKIYFLFITSKLIYYENYESYLYINSVKTKKYLGLIGISASLYHIFVVIPGTIRYIKNYFM